MNYRKNLYETKTNPYNYLNEIEKIKYGYEEVPDGTYKGQITECYITTSRNNHEYIAIKVKITEGSYKNRLITSMYFIPTEDDVYIRKKCKLLQQLMGLFNYDNLSDFIYYEQFNEMVGKDIVFERKTTEKEDDNFVSNTIIEIIDNQEIQDYDPFA